jgi:hypothetical protein
MTAMTLVMSLLSWNYVIQVSDRRFVWLGPDGELQRVDDESNKSVLWAHLNAFAFTGIGNLGIDHRTDLWLAKQIAKWEEETAEDQQGQEGLFRALAQRSTDYFNGPRISRIDKELKRHAFVCGGWGREDDQSELMPHMVRIGNFFHGAPGEKEFGIAVERLQEPGGIKVRWDGQDLLPEEQAELEALTLLNPASVDFAHGASYILGELIRKVAARNDSVGRGLLITVLPRNSIGAGEQSGMLVAAPAEEHVQTFLYLAADGREGIVYGPTVVSGGMVLSDFMAGSLDAPEMADLKRALEASKGPEDSSAEA